MSKCLFALILLVGVLFGRERIPSEKYAQGMSICEPQYSPAQHFTVITDVGGDNQSKPKETNPLSIVNAEIGGEGNSRPKPQLPFCSTAMEWQENGGVRAGQYVEPFKIDRL